MFGSGMVVDTTFRSLPSGASLNLYQKLHSARISVVTRNLDAGNQFLARRGRRRREDALDALASEVRREQLDEIVGEAAQQRAGAKADPGDVLRKQVAGLHHREILLVLGLDDHAGHDADA